MKYFSRSIIFFIVLVFASCSAPSPRTDLKGSAVDYKAGETALKGYIAYDNAVKGRRPGIIVVHEFWGQNEFARKQVDRLAELGYTAFAIDMYGDGKVGKSTDEAIGLAKEVIDNKQLLEERFMAAYELLSKHETVDPDMMAAVGYSFGGTVALQMARSGLDFDGAVIFYGSLKADKKAEPGAVKAKLLVLRGDMDFYIPIQDVTSFTQEMKKAGADFRVVNYEKAKHGFSNPDSDIQPRERKLHTGYSADTDVKSWEELKNFLNTIFNK